MTSGQQRVNAGDPLKISAGTWNDVLDLVDGPRDGGVAYGTGPGQKGPWSPRLVVEAWRASSAESTIASRSPVVLRFYDSGLLHAFASEDARADLRDPQPRGMVVPAISPTDEDAGSGGEVAAAAVGIAVTTIEPGKSGSVAIAGQVLAWVDVTDEAHLFARLESTEADNLVSDTGGPCRILYSDGTGRQLCVLLLNAGSGTVSITAGDFAIIRADAAGDGVDAYKQVNGADSGPAITAYKLGADREDFIEDDLYLAMYDGEKWYAETGWLTECVTFYQTRCIDNVLYETPITIRVIDRDCP